MKKTLLVLTASASLLLSASWAMAANTLTFNDGSGTPDATTISPGGSFSFDITLNVGSPPLDAAGLSLFFETAAANSGLFTITAANNSGSPFGLANWSFGDPAGNFVLTTSGSQTSLAEESEDMGASAGTNQTTPGSFFIENITFTSSGSITPGTYTINNTSENAPSSHPLGRRSVVTDSSFGTTPIEVATYTITVVPEPATWSLLGLGGLGSVALTFLRARRRVS